MEDPMEQALHDLLWQSTGKSRLPGVVAIAARADGVLFEAAAGVRDVVTREPMTIDTVFWLASMTKPITSVAAMQLVEQGRLALDTPIAAVLPQLAHRSVLDGYDPDGAVRLRPARGEVTLRHLLTHTSGYGYDFTSSVLGDARARIGLPTRAGNWAELEAEPLLFDPGTDWMYGISTDIVGKLVEAVSGASLGTYLENNVLGPLGMTDTMFVPGAAQQKRMMTMHARKTDGGLQPMASDATSGRAGFMGGGGALHGTAGDYIRFVRMLLNGGTLEGAAVLRPETVAEMGRNHIGELFGRSLPNVQPHLSNVADFFPGMPQKWGLGFLINTAHSVSGRNPGGLAWAGIGNTFFWIDPVRRIAGVVMTHVLPFADERAMELLWAFETAVYARFDPI